MRHDGSLHISFGAVAAFGLQCLVGMAALGALPQPLPKTFIFDGRFTSSPGLVFNFSRPTATVDRLGAPIASDEPRFGAMRTFVSAPQVELVRDTTSLVLLLGSGLDHDGVTPLMVVRQYVPGTLDVFTVADDALLVAEATGIGRNRTMLAGAAPVADLMQGAIPDKAYNPCAGVVCHGLIVILCEVYRNVDPTSPAGDWQPSATAFVVSQDEGRTWSVHYEDAEVQQGQLRGREWAMQNWWPMQRGATPLEAWFAAADYRWKPATTGGRTLLFHATRAAVGAPWTLEPGATPVEVLDGVGEHAHTAAVIPFGAGGLRLLTSIGDGVNFNRIISATRTDADYASPGWTVKNDYHGSLSTRGYQFVGLAPGPQVGDLILGSDEGGDQIHLLHPDDNPNSRGVPTLLYGHAFEIGAGSRNFVIRTPTPELGGPYVSTFSGGLGVYDTPAHRILYSPDGIGWTEVFSPMSNVLGACIHGGHIYIDSAFGGPGLRRIALPQTLKRRPLLVGSGGVNRLSTHIATPRSSAGAIITKLSPTQVANLNPPPPAFGPVYEIDSLSSNATTLGAWDMAGSLADFFPGAFHTRLWTRLLGSDGMALKMQAIDPSGAHTPFRDLSNRVTQHAWLPTTFRDNFDPSGTGAPYRFEYEADKQQPHASFQTLLAFDSLTNGVSFPGYPLPLGKSAPDELASVSGFQCGPTWTMYVAGELPDDLWDASTLFVTRWPLATIHADIDNSIELIADTQNNRLLADIFSAGAHVDQLVVNNVFWLRGSQLRVALAESGAGLQISASVGSSPPSSDASTASLLTQPNRVQFFSESDQPHVAGFAWYGGRIDETNFTDRFTRETTLTTLDYLVSQPAPPTPSADLNGDGVVNGADLAALLTNWGPCPNPFTSCSADLNSNGVVDGADLAQLLTNWSP